MVQEQTSECLLSFVKDRTVAKATWSHSVALGPNPKVLGTENEEMFAIFTVCTVCCLSFSKSQFLYVNST